MLYYSNSLSMWVLTAIVLLIWFSSGRSFWNLGFGYPPPLAGQPLYIMLVFAVLYLIDFIAGLRSAETMSEADKTTLAILPANGQEYLHYVFVAFTAAVTEEILYRAYFISYVISMAGTQATGIGLSLLLPAIAFGVVHLYQGWKAVVKIIAMAVFLGLVFLQLQNLWAVIAAHFLLDLVGGYARILLDKPFGKNKT